MKTAIIWQITAFYLFLFALTTLLLGWYPHVDPQWTKIFGSLENFRSLHMSFGKASMISLALISLLGIIILIFQKKQMNSLIFLCKIPFAQIQRLHFLWKISILCLVILLILTHLPWVSGLKVSRAELHKTTHFHSVIAFLVFCAVVFCVAANGIYQWAIAILNAKRESGQIPFTPHFANDIHFRRFELAKRFLFLGINVWWPYLLLKYIVGLSALKALWFLPVHLCGVIPYAILKRKHKNKRTWIPI